MNDADFDEYTAFARELALRARVETMPRFRQGLAIDNKLAQETGDAFDPVTEADREAEKVIRSLIERRYPGHGILGEEFGEKESDGPFRWVLDPVDGTRAFICGVPSWTTLIALEVDGRQKVGVIDLPWPGEMYIGGAGGACLVSGQDKWRIAVSGETQLSRARLSTTDPRAGECFTAAEADAFIDMSERVRVTRFGLDACAYALLAAGHLDLVIEAGLQRYDAAALVPVIEQAGGVVTDWNGEPVAGDWERQIEDGGQRGRLVAAASRDLLDSALEKLREV
ncbi:inositol monophosphatase family protein [Aquisalinus flavus]|uniref:Histidinol-phosphatase n=1 Tax=Aquisalinus flavus TaxID=1526572 RepID=A0A8J2V3A7_9PROT|nr:inositol monophosphatase family protein [Aquisalinus flavus]MBD0426110.1 inositol monophosphatase family protein [Aquisalinus flavus]UNE48305.1 inositol monophosphatase family protein [Aquisalinus flavus]GGD10561.1 histidinol-phosphatase [Aquisalinus flavus]